MKKTPEILQLPDVFSIAITDHTQLQPPEALKAAATPQNMKAADDFLRAVALQNKGLAMSVRIGATRPEIHAELFLKILANFGVAYQMLQIPAGVMGLPQHERGGLVEIVSAK